MSNEPDTTNDAPIDPKPYIRTYAQDFAALSGKKAPDISFGTKKTPPATPSHTLKQEISAIETPETTEKQNILNETFNPSRETLNLDEFSESGQAATPSNNDDRAAILARLKEKAQKSAPQQPEPAPVPTPEPTPIPEPKPLPPPPVEVPKPIEPPAPAIESTPILTKEPERFHSFSTDFADRIDEQHASTFSVIAAEKDAAKTRPVVIEKGKAKKQNLLLPISAGVLLILLACGGLFAAYRYMTSRNTPITVLAPSLITADKRITLPANTDLIGALSSQANTAIPQNSIVQDSYTATTTVISLPAPVVLLRNIDSMSTFGVVNADGESRAFFVLHTNDYERTFAAMLQWESTMQSNLADLYPLSASGSAPAQQFTDEVVSNHNVRVLKDMSGNTLLVYGYADAQTLIIARNESAFTLLLNRLTPQS